jgi:hypothetical protein
MKQRAWLLSPKAARASLRNCRSHRARARRRSHRRPRPRPGARNCRWGAPSGPASICSKRSQADERRAWLLSPKASRCSLRARRRSARSRHPR